MAVGLVKSRDKAFSASALGRRAGEQVEKAEHAAVSLWGRSDRGGHGGAEMLAVDGWRSHRGGERTVVREVMFWRLGCFGALRATIARTHGLATPPLALSRTLAISCRWYLAGEDAADVVVFFVLGSW